PEDIGQTMITGPFGPVPLSHVARIVPTEGRYSIRHDAGQRRISVTFNVEGRSLQAAVDEAKAKIAASVKLPAGLDLEFAGAAEEAAAAQEELLLYSAFALVLILMILFVSFHWRRNSWLVLANLPFSLIGGILAIAACRLELSLGAVVGLVTVFGVSARNAILLLAHYEHLVLV